MRIQAFAQLSGHYAKAYGAKICPLFVRTHFYVYYVGKKRPHFLKKSDTDFLIESRWVENI